MQYRSFFSFIGAVVLAITGSIAVSAQTTAPVNGRVELEGTDGKRTPVAGATIDIYRVDIKGGAPSTKTNKKGEFAIAGLLLGGEYTFSVSGPNISPKVHANVKAGQENITITVYPGDGRKFTEAEARQTASTAADTTAPPEMSEEEKKARAELEAKNKEIEAKNAKIQSTNEIISRANREGGEAYSAKNYDLAITKYTEGYDADPDYVGSAPIFLNNRGLALIARARDNNNRVVNADASAKLAAYALVKKDLADSVAGFLKSFNMLKNAGPEASKAPNEANRALRGAKDAFSIAVRTAQIDPSVVEAAKILLPEIQAAETDPAKKYDGDLLMADMYRLLGQTEEAAAGYKKILEASPDNVEALAYAGLLLVDLSWLKDNDKVLAQEGANYLQKFVALAPDTHKLKEGAAEYLALLKTQNVVPVKAPAKKRN
jgi:tetratricopeptide (TPR) repeat protein